MSHPAVICEKEFSVARLQSSVRREADQFFLLREMHHRFANSFTVLNGMLRREFASFAQPELQETLGRCEARIVALGNLHRYLMIGGREDRISVQFYIEWLPRWRCRRERRSTSSSAARWARSSSSIRACRSATGIR